MTTVDLWIDPYSPWAYLAARWMLEVEQVRDVTTRFHVMCLGVLNENREMTEERRQRMASTWQAARAGVAVEQKYGQAELRTFIMALGLRNHVNHEPYELATIRAALSDAGCDPAIAEACTTSQFDEAVRASHNEGMESVGTDVGTPVIRIDGQSIFGPVISPAPKGEAAGQLFDGVRAVLAYPGFFELKRSRTAKPIFD